MNRYVLGFGALALAILVTAYSVAVVARAPQPTVRP
jgi:hypothetical protein